MRFKFISVVIILFALAGIPYSVSLYGNINDNQIGNSETNSLDFNSLKSSGDGYGDIDNSNHHLFWFVQIADTQSIWYSDKSKSDFRDLLSETRNIIQPEFFVHTGDIVDSDYDNTFGTNERDQRIEEWQDYNKIITETGMNSNFYFDLMGNHDAYGDPGFPHYMNYSIVGSETGQTQIAWEREYSFGKYSFIGLHTAEDRGVQYPYQVFGYLTRAELDWYEEQLINYKDYDLTFTFGHQPAFEINSELSTSMNTFIGLTSGYGVDFYGMGHGHANTYDNSFGTFCVETEAFDKKESAFRIIAVDDNKISSSVEYVNEWPQGVITSPVSDAFTNEAVLGTSNLRVLAWDKKGVNKVSWSALDVFGNRVIDWTDLTKETNELWEGPWNNTLETGQRYNIQAKIEGGSGTTIREMSFSSASPIRGFTMFNVILLSFISFFALIIALPARVFLRRRKDLEKYGKKPDQLVSKELSKLYLIKAAIYLLAPVTFGYLVHGELEVIFPFFTVSATGVHYYSLNLIFTGVGFLLAILPQGFQLSKSCRGSFQAVTILALAGAGLLLFFHGGHYLIALLAPGLWAMVCIDIIMFIKSRDDKTYNR